MNTLVELVLSNALAAGALALVVTALYPLVRRPAARNALWLIVLARLFLPPVWGIPLRGPSPATEGEAAPGADTSADDPAVVPTEPGTPEGAEPFLPAAADETAPPTRPQSGTVFQSAIPLLQSAIPPLWLGAAGLVVALTAARARRFERALRFAGRAPAELQAHADAVAVRLGLRRSPGVWLVPGRLSPMLWLPGLRPSRARLLLPAELLPRLSGDELSAILAHELAHLRRGDPWVRWLEVAALALYWWHPLLGWVRRRLRESEEQCCDAWVVAVLPARHAYATALVETVAFLDEGPAPTPLLASGAGPVPHLQRRIGMIMRGTTPGRLTRWGLLAAFGFAAAALAVGPDLSRAQPAAGGERPREQPKDPFAPPGERTAPERADRPKDAEPDGDPRPRPERRDAEESQVERARRELERARAEARRAMDRVREAEARLSRLTGDPAPGYWKWAPVDPLAAEPAPNPGGPGGRAPSNPAARPERTREEDRTVRDLQRQMAELHRQMAELKEMLRREPARWGPPPGPGGPGGGDSRPGADRPKAS